MAHDQDEASPERQANGDGDNLHAKQSRSSAKSGLGLNGVRDGADIHNGGNDEPSEEAKLKESLLAKMKRIWLSKTGIDNRTYMQLFKGAIAPTIAIAGYQATPWAETFTTIGYLVGIMAILSLPIQPRAKFLQTMLVNVVVVCFSCAVSLLAMSCVVRARINTEGYDGGGQGGSVIVGNIAAATYNSSASAVAGTWLFVWIYGISCFRANRPQFTIPSIMMAIFANVSMIYAPQFSNMTQAKGFAQKLLEAFLTGFGVSTAVSLLIFPFTSRQVVFAEMSGFIGSLRGIMKANLDYMHSLEEADMFAPHRVNTAGDEVIGNKEADILRGKMQALEALAAKFSTDLVFAKREIAIGKVGPDDLHELARKLRMIMIPVIGLSTMQDVFQRICESNDWDQNLDFAHAAVDDAPNENEKNRIEAIHEWHHLMKRLREPFGTATAIVDEGLEHIAITLQLAPKRQRRSAEDAAEANGDQPQPGESGFVEFWDKRSKEVIDNREETLRTWCEVHGIELPADFFKDPSRADFQAPAWMNDDTRTTNRQRVRRQLFLSLHLQFMLANVNRQVLAMILYCEQLQASGKLSKSRLIVPGFKRLRKWVITSLTQQSEGHENEQIDSGNHATMIYMGEAFKKRKDPEHLPPSNFWERSTDVFRQISHFFASSESAFGLRVASATMSIAIVAYLRDTQEFFTRERLFWSQIMISISMTPSSGQSVRGFLLRIIGTFFAMLLAWIAYYIVDGHTAGVLVFFFVVLHAGVYVVLKYPAYIPVGMISQVTVTLIIGYQLQVEKIGRQVAQSNGQVYFPVYILGPVRLATVAGGLLLAFIWTVFPYPITEHSQLRQNLGRSLYLLANYYSIMHETVRSRMRGCDADPNDRHRPNDKKSPSYKLDKARHKIFSKCNMVLSGLRQQSAFIKFDIPFGGKFPREQYQQIIGLMQSCLNFMSLVSLASATFSELSHKDPEDLEHSSQWLRDFRRLIREANVTSEAVTTLFSLLSAAVTSGSPLPPYVRVPEPYALAQRLDELDRDLLSVRHIAEPGYSSFAVMQVGTRCVIDDLRKILGIVRGLVGELDFSFHVVSTAESSANQSEETVVYKPESRGERAKKVD